MAGAARCHIHGWFAQHGVTGFKRVKNSADSDWRLDSELNFGADAGKVTQMKRQRDMNQVFATRGLACHASVCTSTDNTAGRSRTMGAQVSPASDEAYTCPPLVPK